MVYYIYTDGSTRKNGKENSVGGYAFVVFNDRGNVIDAYAKTEIENTTNNRMELTAILAALFMYEKRMRIKDQRAEIVLYSDSEYALKSLFSWSKEWADNDWHTWGPYLKNLYDGKRNSWSRFTYMYVKGHDKSLGNNMADQLATGELKVEDVLKKNK